MKPDRKAIAAQRRAKRFAEELFSISNKFEAEIKLGFPADVKIEYRHGDRLRSAMVVDVSGTRLKVRGEGGTEYWIEVYRVLEELDS
jgi:hypothetical protein